MDPTDLVPTLEVVEMNSTVTSSIGPCTSVVDRIGIIEALGMYRPMAAEIEKLVTPIWYAFGFPGNLLAFLVWIQVRMRPSSGCYLAALALNDFIFLLFSICFELQNAWNIKTLYQPIWCELFPILFLSAQHLSPLLVLGFTVERYISICHPFKRERYCSTRRALIVIGSLVCFVLALNSVQGYFWTFSGKECTIRTSAMENGTASLWSVWSWVTELLIFGVVPVATLMLNILVIKEANRMSDRGKTMMMMQQTTPGRSSRSHTSSQSSATTFTLLVVSFYLIFSTLPVTVCYTLFFSFPPGNPCVSENDTYTDPTWQSHFSYWSARIVIQEIGMSHYVGNFYIYLLTGVAFRRELKSLFLRLFCNDSGRRWLYGDTTQVTELTTFNNKSHNSNGGGSNKVYFNNSLEKNHDLV